MTFIIWAAIFIMTACGEDANENGEPTLLAPGAPTVEEIYAENRELAILWDVVNNASTYNLYWNTTGGVTTSDNSITGLRAPHYVHSELSLFKTYSYAVTAVNAGGASGLSNEMSALAANVPEELWKRIASDGHDGDHLGFSVALSGDYAVAGVLDGDGLGTFRGAAYVFARNQGGPDNWGQVAKLVASDPEDSDQFGSSVAISGDNVLVGARYEDGLGTHRGAAYVFDRNQGGSDNWGQVTKLTASTPEDAAYFGCSVALSGDFAVVGAYAEDVAGTDLGAAYVFDRTQGGPDNWGQVAKLVASDAEDSDQFGSSVAISGDNVVVGARYEDGQGTSRGAVYIYGRNHGGADTWGEVMKLTASDAKDQDWFGFSVDIDGDYALVGAPYVDGAGSNRGAVYIF